MNSIIQFVRQFASLFVWWTVIQPWELALRVRLGKAMTNIGPGLHWCVPYVHHVYRQSVRTRMINLSTQTLTTRDNHTITLSGAFAYRIVDLMKLYSTLHHAEATLTFMVMSKIAEFVHDHDLDEAGPANIEQALGSAVNLSEYGLCGESVKIIDYAVVRTYRLIMDQRYSHGGDVLTTSDADRRNLPQAAGY